MECPQCKAPAQYQGERAVGPKLYQVHICVNPQCKAWAIRTTMDQVLPEWKENAIKILAASPQGQRKSKSPKMG